MHPYGIVSGYRAYLVALTVGASGKHPSTWRIDRMSGLTVLEAPSAVPPDFETATTPVRVMLVNPGRKEWSALGQPVESGVRNSGTLKGAQP